MKIVALCDVDTAIGLRFAGITDVRVPNEQKSTIQLWNQIEDDHTDIGLIILTEQLSEQIGKQLNEFRLRNLLPVIVEIPDKKGRKKEHIDYVSQLIKKAVGMDIKH
jgi:V/A-type H+/Na+-transporting ATPase subunit F